MKPLRIPSQVTLALNEEIFRPSLISAQIREELMTTQIRKAFPVEIKNENFLKILLLELH